MSINTNDDELVMTSEETNGVGSTYLWEIIIDEHTVPFLEYCLRTLHALYIKLTYVNVITFILKNVPMCFYIHTFIRDVYMKSSERIEQKRVEMQDIQLQIQIVNTKLCVRGAEFTERSEQLRQCQERLRKVRASVRDVIAADEVLRRALQNVAQWDTDDVYLHVVSQEQGGDFLMELLKEFKFDHVSKPESPPVNFEYGKCAQNTTPESSLYSSLSDLDVKHDCRVKIVRVTNVYKIAYLKHYIKQKRLRKATKRALLKKKMESIKNLLQDWQKTLSMVINSKLTILNIDPHPIDVASQEAMGDYSKHHGSSDSDSDMRNSWSDMCYEEYSQNWAQNQYKQPSYNYEDVPDTISRELHDAQDYGDGQYTAPPIYCDRGKVQNTIMMSIVEETNSQIAIEEIKSETDDEYEMRDLIML